MNIEQLKKSGYRVEVLHFRFTEKPKKGDIAPHCCLAFASTYYPTGGETQVVITSRDGKVKATGVAKCSIKENYCRKTGVKLALERAVKNLNEVTRLETVENGDVLSVGGNVICIVTRASYLDEKYILLGNLDSYFPYSRAGSPDGVYTKAELIDRIKNDDWRKVGNVSKQFKVIVKGYYQ